MHRIANCKQKAVIYDGVAGAGMSANHSKENQMITITWVEILLMGLLATSLAFSIRFCVRNYTKASREGIRFIRREVK